jgi:hypothetical protein
MLDALTEVTRDSGIRREPRCLVTYDHAHWVKTITRFPAWGRNATWMAAHASRSSPYQHEREQIPVLRRVDLDLRDLERFQKFRPNRGGAMSPARIIR